MKYEKVKQILCLLVLLTVLGSVCVVSSQGYEQWSVDIGGEDTENFKAIKETSDNGFIIVGYVESFTTDDKAVYLVKTDSMGEIEWSHSYGDAQDDEGNDVIQTTDGGYLVSGYTKSYGAGLTDVWLIKTDSTGEIQWEQVIGGAKNDVANSVIALENGEYVVVGSTSSYGAGSSDCWLLKTSSEGEILWNMTLGGTSYDNGHDIISVDDGLLIIGETSSYGAGWNDFWLVKLDMDGVASWNKTYGGSLNDAGKSIIATDDGYLLAGTSESFGDNLPEGYIVKVDSSGELQWENNYGGASDDYLESVTIYPDTGYLCVGYTLSTGTGESDVWLFSINNDGELLEESFYGGALRDRMYDIIPTSDDGYIIAGFTWSFGTSGNGYLIKLTLEEPESEPETTQETETETETESETETEPEVETEQEESSGGIPGFQVFPVAIGLVAASLALLHKRHPFFSHS